jgi:hypothetical protein
MNMITKSPKSFVFKAILLAFTLTLLSGVSNAQSAYYDRGEIFSISKLGVSLGEGPIPLSATVKIVLKNGIAGDIDDLGKGDLVKLTVLTLDGKFLIDRIEQLSEPD